MDPLLHGRRQGLIAFVRTKEDCQRRRTEILGDGGGYILAPSHNLQKDIPLANILARYNVGLRS